MSPKIVRSTHSHTLVQRGFSLVELIVAVAIIAILALIALPQYQKYAIRAKLTTALSEVSAAKPVVEAILAEGRALPTGQTVKPEEFGLPQQTSQCASFTAVSIDFGALEIWCNLRFSGRYNISAVDIVRQVDGAWKCRIDAGDASWLPAGCTQR